MRERIRALIGVLVLAALALLGLPAIASASQAGDPFTAEFNYVAVSIGSSIGGDARGFVHTPAEGDPIVIRGEYTDSEGNFQVTNDGGITFPPLELDFDLFNISASIELNEGGTGSYDQATGRMTLSFPTTRLILGSEDVEGLEDVFGTPIGADELSCALSPLAVSFSSDGDIPFQAKDFEDKGNLRDGALAGIWGTRPASTAIKGPQSVCDIISGFLKPVSGLWLANSTEPIVELPPSPFDCPVYSQVRTGHCWGPPPVCEEGTAGGYPWCGKPNCPEGSSGDYPGCFTVDPMTELTKLAIGPKKRQLRAGKNFNLRVRVRALVGLAPDRFRVTLRSSNRQVRLPKAVVVKLEGDTGIATVKVKATRKAKGRANIIASYPGFKATSEVVVKKPIKTKPTRR